MAERDPKSVKGDFKFDYKNTLIVEEEPRLNVPMLYTMKPGSHAFAVAISSFGPAHCVSLNQSDVVDSSFAFKKLEFWAGDYFNFQREAVSDELLPANARSCDGLVETARRSVLKVGCDNYDLRYRVQKLTLYVQAEAVKLEGEYGFDTAAK